MQNGTLEIPNSMFPAKTARDTNRSNFRLRNWHRKLLLLPPCQIAPIH